MGDSGYLWIRDDLPTTMPDPSIFIYEYDSNLVFGGTQGTFSDTANVFLEDLYLERDEASAIAVCRMKKD